jgi:hypothetical protein
MEPLLSLQLLNILGQNRRKFSFGHLELCGDDELGCGERVEGVQEDEQRDGQHHSVVRQQGPHLQGSSYLKYSFKYIYINIVVIPQYNLMYVGVHKLFLLFRK